ncbi:unnamed protein product, partial [Prorocentrum cordatum]
MARYAQRDPCAATLPSPPWPERVRLEGSVEQRQGRLFSLCPLVFLQPGPARLLAGMGPGAAAWRRASWMSAHGSAADFHRVSLLLAASGRLRLLPHAVCWMAAHGSRVCPRRS